MKHFIRALAVAIIGCGSLVTLPAQAAQTGGYWSFGAGATTATPDSAPFATAAKKYGGTDSITNGDTGFDITYGHYLNNGSFGFDISYTDYGRVAKGVVTTPKITGIKSATFGYNVSALSVGLIARKQLSDSFSVSAEYGIASWSATENTSYQLQPGYSMIGLSQPISMSGTTAEAGISIGYKLSTNWALQLDAHGLLGKIGDDTKIGTTMTGVSFVGLEFTHFMTDD